MKVICEGCEQEIEVECYVYGQRIETIDRPILGRQTYTAVANVKFFCSHCGHLHNYVGINKELSDVEIGEIVKNVVPFYIEKRLKELQNGRN